MRFIAEGILVGKRGGVDHPVVVRLEGNRRRRRCLLAASQLNVIPASSLPMRRIKSFKQFVKGVYYEHIN